MLPRSRAPLLLVLLLATLLRFYRLDYQSYWNDEGNSRAMTAKSVSAILRDSAADIHPPAYYLVLKAWAAFTGETEFALRSFSALTGIVLIALLYRLGLQYFNPTAALLAALLSAVNPFLIYYSQEARMYALLVTLGAASFGLFAKWLKPSRGNWGLEISYCFVTTLGLYTHYAFPFILLAQNLAALGDSVIYHRAKWRPRLTQWFTLQFFTLLLFTPWLPTAYRQLSTWPSAREFPAFFTAMADVTRYLTFGRTIETDKVMLGLWAVGLLFFLTLTFHFSPTPSRPSRITNYQLRSPVLLWLLVPIGLTLAFGLFTEAFSKFLLIAVPPLCLLLGHALVPRRPSLFSLFHFLLFIPIAYFTYTSLSNLYFNPTYFRDDYRAIAQRLLQIHRPTDAVILNSPNQIEAFGYYYPHEIFPLPTTRPLDPATTEAHLTQIASTHQRLFVLYWGDEQADPDHFIENWLNANTFKAGDEWHGNVRLATYAAASPAREPAVRVGAGFGTHIVLEGYTLQAVDLAQGDILQITLFWTTDTQLAERYKVFIHLYDALDAPPVAQWDSEPGGGRLPTVDWQPAQVYPDNYGVLVPSDLSPGAYTLMLGLYTPIDSSRLGVTLNDNEIGDRLEVEQIVVK